MSTITMLNTAPDGKEYELSKNFTDSVTADNLPLSSMDLQYSYAIVIENGSTETDYYVGQLASEEDLQKLRGQIRDTVPSDHPLALELQKEEPILAITRKGVTPLKEGVGLLSNTAQVIVPANPGAGPG